MIYDILIIGGGASGLFLGANLKSKNVAILEKNSAPGRKILASGGGRCNITNKNISRKNYLGDGKFIENALKNLKYSDVLSFFKELKFKEQKRSQFFCESSSKDVLNSLLKRVGAKIFYNSDVIYAYKNGEIFEVLTSNGAKFRSRKLVVASGALSYKSLGASDIGLKIANDFGIKFVPFAPALVGFSVQKSEFWFKELSGISVRVKLKTAQMQIIDDVLFTHRGISGPAILNASLFWTKGSVSINFLPNFNVANLVCGKKQLSSVLPLPKRFVIEFLRSKGLRDMAFNDFSNEQKVLINELFDYKFSPAGTFGFERAEVSKGGVLTDEIGENFECRSVCGLYFIGEVLDITGMLGGYNIHFAFASASAAAKDLNGHE